MKKNALAQPLMMRRDYGTPDEKKDKEALMFKEVPIEDYDQVPKKQTEEQKHIIEDYDNHGCRGGCFLCDR